jgi:adenine-specific DNA-methyltransferase
MPKQPVAKITPPLSDEQLAALRTLMPQAFTEGKIDPDKLRATLGDLADDRPERYFFSWAGKRDAIRLLQAPSRATLVPCPEESLNADGTACHPEERSDEGSPRNKETLIAFGAHTVPVSFRESDRQSQNLFIEGDNLEVLKLLYKPYFRRIKMIYIDPPYNTGNDFVYPDNFADPLDTYLQLTGQKDSAGNLLTSNPETGGRYHSAWLSMMYPRLFLARQLLREDGVIFVSIDDHEVHTLRLIMNEIFGEENFVADIVVVNNLKGRSDKRYVATAHERLMMYARDAFEERGLALTEELLAEYNNEDEGGKYRLLGLRKRGGADTRERRPKLYFPIYVDPKNGNVKLEESAGWIRVLPQKSDGVEGCWRWGAKKIQDNLDILVGRPVGSNGKFDVFEKDYLETDGTIRRMKPKSVLFGSDFSTDSATKAFRELMGNTGFKNPKPVPFIKDLVSYATDEDDIILDFFAGSCTAAQAVLELNREDGGNRRFIMVQLPEPTGNKQFPTIAEIGKERIRRVAARMKKEREGQLALDKPKDLGFKVFKLAPSNYKQWDVGATHESPETYARQAELFADPLVEGWQPENVLYEVALKEGYGLNVQIEKTAVKGVQRVADPDKSQSFYLTLAAKITLKDLRPLDLKKDDLFVCRDTALDDEAAANLALQCRLKTI